MFRSLTSTVMFQAEGMSLVLQKLLMPISDFYRILEYLSRDDADYAVKSLDGKELRGQVLRVTVGEEVSVAGSDTTGC